MLYKRIVIISLCLFFIFSCCKKPISTNPPPPPPPPVVLTNDVYFWLTYQSTLLQKQTGILSFGTTANAAPFIDVDSTQVFQTVDGFGYTLTGGSAYVINQMPAVAKQNLLNELFGTGTGSIGVSYIRISIGASDLNDHARIVIGIFRFILNGDGVKVDPRSSHRLEILYQIVSIDLIILRF